MLLYHSLNKDHLCYTLTVINRSGKRCCKLSLGIRNKISVISKLSFWHCFLTFQKTTLNEIEAKHKAELTAQSKADYQKRKQEEEFLQKCIDEADEELDKEKEEHDETKRKLKELQVSTTVSYSCGSTF